MPEACAESFPMLQYCNCGMQKVKVHCVSVYNISIKRDSSFSVLLLTCRNGLLTM